MIGVLGDIKTSEKLNFSWNSFYRTVLNAGLRNGLIVGLSVGLFFGLFEGLFTGLIGVLAAGLGGGIKTTQFDVRDKLNPNQGIKYSIRNGLFVGLISALSSGLFVGLIEALSGSKLGRGIVVGLASGLQAALKHLSLRIVLYQSGCSPWNYARFLEHAENHRFIQRTGGRYRFVHDLLRKRFAATLKQP